jgi:WD40 repeat protein
MYRPSSRRPAHSVCSGNRACTCCLNGPSVTSVVFAHDDATLLSGGANGSIRIWDLRAVGATAEPRATTPPPLPVRLGMSKLLFSTQQKGAGLSTPGITSLSLHPDGSQLLASHKCGHLLTYSLGSLESGPTRCFSGHMVSSFYVKACFSGDGTHVASGSGDGNVHVWELDGGAGDEPYRLGGHGGEVTAVAWCPSDFYQLATAGDDNTVRLWGLPGRQQAEERASPRQRRRAGEEAAVEAAAKRWKARRETLLARAASAHGDENAGANDAEPRSPVGPAQLEPLQPATAVNIATHGAPQPHAQATPLTVAENITGTSSTAAMSALLRYSARTRIRFGTALLHSLGQQQPDEQQKRTKRTKQQSIALFLRTARSSSASDGEGPLDEDSAKRRRLQDPGEG